MFLKTQVLFKFLYKITHTFEVKISWNRLHKTACRQHIDKLTSVIFVYKAHHWAPYHMLFQNKSELYKKKWGIIVKEVCGQKS